MITIKSNKQIQESLGRRFKEQRLLKNFSRKTLAENSGVSYESIKKFENTGNISLISLISLANCLDKISEIENLLSDIEPQNKLELKNLNRQRGTQ